MGLHPVQPRSRSIWKLWTLMTTIPSLTSPPTRWVSSPTRGAGGPIPIPGVFGVPFPNAYPLPAPGMLSKHEQHAALGPLCTRELLSSIQTPGMTLPPPFFPSPSALSPPPLCRRLFLRMWLWAQSF